MLLLQLCNAAIKDHTEQAQLISQYDITCYYVTSDSDLGLLYTFYCAMDLHLAMWFWLGLVHSLYSIWYEDL